MTGETPVSGNEKTHQLNKKLQLLSILAHDSIIDNLTVIRGINAFPRKNAESDNVRSLLEKQEKSLQQLKEKTDFLFEYRKKGLPVPAWINVGYTLSSAASHQKERRVSLDPDI